jgi:hypothetical protein
MYELFLFGKLYEIQTILEKTMKLYVQWQVTNIMCDVYIILSDILNPTLLTFENTKPWKRSNREIMVVFRRNSVAHKNGSKNSSKIADQRPQKDVYIKR